jgi:hypothetical protein
MGPNESEKLEDEELVVLCWIGPSESEKLEDDELVVLC